MRTKEGEMKTASAAMQQLEAAIAGLAVNPPNQR